MILTKKFVITHKNGVIQIKEKDFHCKLTPGNGFSFAEFDTVEDLENYIRDNKLISMEDALNTKDAFIGDTKVDINEYIFDNQVFLKDKE